MKNANEIATKIVENANNLQTEIGILEGEFERTDFFGDNSNFPYAHFGYMMAAMGQIDLMSVCAAGHTNENQTKRMTNFLKRYYDDANKVLEHEVVIQLFRHSLMHTGGLPYIRDPDTNIVYTWRLYFRELPVPSQHYTLTDSDLSEQPELSAAVTPAPAGVKVINISIPAFAADIRRIAEQYTKTMLADSTGTLAANCEKIYPTALLQPIKRKK